MPNPFNIGLVIIAGTKDRTALEWSDENTIKLRPAREFLGLMSNRPTGNEACGTLVDAGCYRSGTYVAEQCAALACPAGRRW